MRGGFNERSFCVGRVDLIDQDCRRIRAFRAVPAACTGRSFQPLALAVAVARAATKLDQEATIRSSAGG